MSTFDNPILQARIREILEVKLLGWEGMIWSCEQYCESPIEIAMLRALATDPELLVAGEPHIIVPDGSSEGDPESRCIIEMQKRIGRFRADFAVTVKFPNERRVIVECDGHAFHERTKEQAQREKSRDRELLMAGWPVMRFTGSEIHKDAQACVRYVAAFLNDPGTEVQALTDVGHA